MKKISFFLSGLFFLNTSLAEVYLELTDVEHSEVLIVDHQDVTEDSNGNLGYDVADAKKYIRKVTATAAASDTTWIPIAEVFIGEVYDLTYATNDRDTGLLKFTRGWNAFPKVHEMNTTNYASEVKFYYLKNGTNHGRYQLYMSFKNDRSADKVVTITCEHATTSRWWTANQVKYDEFKLIADKSSHQLLSPNEGAGLLATQFGSGNTADGNYAIAMGQSNYATGLRAVALGFANKSLGNNSFTAGGQNTAGGGNSMAVGYKSISNGAQAIAIGNTTESIGAQSVALGYMTIASGDQSVAMGNGADAIGQAAFAMGNAALASGQGSVAIGHGGQANSHGAVSLGRFNRANGYASVAMGSGSRAEGNSAVAMGNNSYTGIRDENDELVAFGGNAFAMGYRSGATGYASVSMGDRSLATATRTVALGQENKAEGDNSIAIGYQNIASEKGAIAFGWGNEASGFHSSAFGVRNQTNGRGQFVVGEYNLPPADAPAGNNITSDDYMFIVGNGTSAIVGKQSNALTIQRSGKATFNGDTTHNGNVNISGVVTIQPQGDISMGDFATTAE